MLRKLSKLLPRQAQQFLRQIRGSMMEAQGYRRGKELAETLNVALDSGTPIQPETSSNPLTAYFDAHREGPGIWKWRHYFDIYHRHFQKFIGKDVNVLEIGVYSGGSLGMWMDYFGDRCRIFGVDIEEPCKVYENGPVKIFIGDQADRSFWQKFRREAPPLDVIIDDGGHQAHQQIVTLEETLRHLKPGGVYLCEDVHGAGHEFVRYISGFAHNLNAFPDAVSDPNNPERQMVTPAMPFQSAIYSIHLYPYIVVIERNSVPVSEFCAPKHGTQWQPFSGSLFKTKPR